MEMNEFQRQALQTAIYPQELKTIFSKSDRLEIAKELGDVLWYLSVLANDLGYSLDEVAALNIEKIRSRNERGKLHGNGDNR